MTDTGVKTSFTHTKNNKNNFVLVARNCNPHFNLTITGSQVRDFIPLDLLKGGGDKDQDAGKNKTVPEVQLYVPKIPKVH